MAQAPSLKKKRVWFVHGVPDINFRKLVSNVPAHV